MKVEAVLLVRKDVLKDCKKHFPKKKRLTGTHHSLGLFVGMDELLSSSVVGEVHVHLPHFSGPSKSTSEHGCVSANITNMWVILSFVRQRSYIHLYNGDMQ